MADIEFLPESVDTNDVGEELSGIGRRLPRWLMMVTAAAVLVTAGVVAITRVADTHRATHAGGLLGPLVTSRTVPINPHNGSGLKPVLRGVPAREPVLELAVVGTTTWVLQPDALRVVGPTGRIIRLALPPALQDARLVTDPRAGVVWLAAKGVARAYDARTGRREFATTVPAFSAAAAMHGQLYVTLGTQLLETGPAIGPPRVVLTVPVPISALAADPVRGRLIAVYPNGPSQVIAVVPRPDGPARIVRSVEVHTIEPTLADVDGAIWLAGYSTGDGVLMRLDPRTLRPAMRPWRDELFGSGALLVAGGTSSIWVRSGDTGSQLYCLDAGSGRLMQSWLLAGTVASAAGRAVLGATFGPVTLNLGRCRG
jgi:hypothetical protein